MKRTRRDFLKTGVGGLGLGLALGGFPRHLNAAAKNARRPNVLFIAVDDLRPQLGCYGRSRMKSPHIDRLAASGTVFRRAYCQQAVCSPSRTSLMTGRRPDTTRVYDLQTHFRDTIPDVVTIPQHFMQNGYHAVGLSKIYHGGLNDEKSWSEPWKSASELGDVQSYNLKSNQEAIAKRKAEAKKKGLKGKALSNASRKGPPAEAADVPDNAYPDGATADAAVKALGRLKDRPFFLAVGFLKPHLPFNSPKKYWDLYDPGKLDLADNPFAPKGAPEFARTKWGELRSYLGIPKKGPIPDEQARWLIHGYYASVSFTDAQVGKILDELDRLGLSDNTIVVLWGDHGWHLGDHGFWCKHTNYENAIHSPLIARAPGMKGGQATDALTEFVDVYPSLCELAGLPLPEGLEGTSFAPLMKNPDRPWKKAALSQYPRGNRMGYSVRTDRYHYVEWRERKSGKQIAAELYDHKTDPGENENVAGRPENQAVVDRHAKLLRGGWRAARGSAP